MSDNPKPDIWQLQSQFNIQGLIRALGNEDKNIRKRAAAALRTMGAKEALPALRAAFAAEEDTNTRMIIATAIEMLRGEPGEEGAPPRVQTSHLSGSNLVKRLLERLNSDDSEVIIKAAHQLGDLGDKVAVEPLILLFNDNNKTIQVRLAVAEALLKLESAPVEVALLANLRHADWHIRRNGAAILGQLKAEWAVQPLARALRDAHPIVRRTARAALKNIGTPESRKALAQDSSDAPMTRATPQQPTTASGITVKTTGQKAQQRPASGMLRKHLEQPDIRAAGTQPLQGTGGEGSPDEKKSQQKHFEPTMPLSSDVLNQLAALDEDDEDDA